MLDFPAQYDAFRRRDPAFDGVVFVAVNTDDGDLSVEEIAHRAGFASSRRMRAAFMQLYGRPPSAFRKTRH